MQCGGQVVHPGDWIVGDEDGVVVVPAEKIEQTLATAKRIVAAELEIERAIRKGEDLATLLRSQEVIQQKKNTVFIPQLRMPAQGRRK